MILNYMEIMIVLLMVIATFIGKYPEQVTCLGFLLMWVTFKNTDSLREYENSFPNFPTKRGIKK